MFRLNANELRRSQRNRNSGLHGFNLKNWGEGVFIIYDFSLVKRDHLFNFLSKVLRNGIKIS